MRSWAALPVNYSSRFWLFAPLAVLAVLALGAMGHGWMVRDTVEKNLDRIHGIDAQFFEGAIDGHPLLRDALGCGNRFADSLDQIVGHNKRLTVSNL